MVSLSLSDTESFKGDLQTTTGISLVNANFIKIEWKFANLRPIKIDFEYISLNLNYIISKNGRDFA